MRHLASPPFVFKHVAIMPDGHQGYGMPIGGVCATEGVVVPNMVGVDIGCGLCAVKTNLLADDLGYRDNRETLKKVMGEIRDTVPVGFNRHNAKQDPALMPENLPFGGPHSTFSVVERELDKAMTQLGTLGGGNHFIEIQKGSDGHVWVMIHSGSRNIGKQVADYYNRLAVELNEKWHASVPKAWELAFLPLNSTEGDCYRREMQYCVDFALANRQLMMNRVMEAMALAGGYQIEPMINIAHNYAAMEHHFGHDVLVHRKGATRARLGEVGIIPGSQGTKSYIVNGKGSRDSFESCSHGAGRKLGRKQACRQLKLEDEIALLDAAGVVHGIRSEKDLDEAPGAYKNIAEVMENQADLSTSSWSCLRWE